MRWRDESDRLLSCMLLASRLWCMLDAIDRFRCGAERSMWPASDAFRLVLEALWCEVLSAEVLRKEPSCRAAAAAVTGVPSAAAAAAASSAGVAFAMT